MRAKIVALALLALAPAGCDEDEKKPRDHDELTIQLEDPAGAPLAGAVVTTTPATEAVTAGADGRAVFTDLAPGTYLFHASLAGRQPKTVSFEVPDGDASLSIPLVSTDGLVAWYPFDGNGEDVAGGHDATAVDATLAPDRFGRADLAYAFDGVADHVTVPTSLTQATAQLTVTAWVKPASVTGQHCLVYNVDHAEFGLYVQLDRLSFFLRTSVSGGFGSSTDPVMTAGTWQHVALTRAAGVVTLYHHGEVARSLDLQDSGAWGYAMAGAIGVVPDGQAPFEGAIEDVQVYTRALSAAEVAALARR